MPSQTPQFDKALDEYFNSLRADKNGGLWKTCRFSSRRFYIRPEDIAFYKKVRVPLPTLDPEERRRNRLASLNSFSLFKKISAHSRKKIISTYPSSSPFKVYEHHVWYSDAWNPFDYGRAYDLEKPFFGQWYDLMLTVPRPNLISDPTNLNSDYTSGSKGVKNCYFTFDQKGGEDLYYHECCTEDKNCIDCWALDESDTCYDSKSSERLFKCFWCEDTKETTESAFLFDCRNCDYCFMSSNLRNKKYVIRNTYVGKEEYTKFMKELNLGSWETVQKLKKEFRDMKNAAARKPSNNENAENCFGNYITHSKNVYFGLYVAESKDVAYVEGTGGDWDSYDILGGGGNELCYQVAGNWQEDNYDVKFSTTVDNSEGVEYSDLLTNCTNCFGCIGLRNKSYCIFNVQYTQKEYWAKVDEIKTKMLAVGDYGEFFPPRYLPFPYRAAYVGHYPGFDDYENATQFGYQTAPLEEVEEKIEGDIIDAKDLSDSIKDVKDDILKKIIFDSKNKKHFRILKQELHFYRKYSLPFPREHPSIRMAESRKDFNLVVRFYKRKCARCGVAIETTYGPERPEKNIWCEKCYKKEIG